MSDFLLILCLLLTACHTAVPQVSSTPDTEELRLTQLSEHVYQHISYLPTRLYGKVPCNGMVYIVADTAIVFDTPVTVAASELLIERLTRDMGCHIKAVVVNHHHVDCLGGLAAFHERGIPSYGHSTSVALARADDYLAPQHTFDTMLMLTMSEQRIENRYFGAAHTADNIVSYLPGEQVLYGGCMMKSLRSGRGNLADADTLAWSATVRAVRTAYPDTRLVIPGHGTAGDTSLLRYTIEMFE